MINDKDNSLWLKRTIIQLIRTIYSLQELSINQSKSIKPPSKVCSTPLSSPACPQMSGHVAGRPHLIALRTWLLRRSINSSSGSGSPLLMIHVSPGPSICFSCCAGSSVSCNICKTPKSLAPSHILSLRSISSTSLPVIQHVAFCFENHAAVSTPELFLLRVRLVHPLLMYYQSCLRLTYFSTSVPPAF